MTTSDIEFLVVAVAAFSLFGGVLGWASWMEAREEKQKALTANAQANPNEKTNGVGRIPSARAIPKIASRPF
jgi:hypothetical protein